MLDVCVEVCITDCIFVFSLSFFQIINYFRCSQLQENKDTPAKVNRVLQKEVKMQCTKWENLNGLNLHRFCTCYLRTYRLLCLLWIGWLIWNDWIYFTNPPWENRKATEKKENLTEKWRDWKNLGPFAFKADHNRVIGTAWTEGWQ